MVVKPYYGMSGTEFQMDSVSFGLMVAITMIIAVAGYLGNDYFDIGIDRINRPDRPSVNGKLGGRFLLTTALMLSMLLIAGIVVLSFRMGMVIPALVLLLALGTVWWYAGILKKSFIWGNLAVSLMSSLTLGMAWFFEWLILNQKGTQLFETKSITQVSIGISFFAFLLSFKREIVKDMEDMEGDRLFGCRSLPIVKGIRSAKIVTWYLSFILLASLFYCQYWLLQQNFMMVAAWLILAVEVPIVIFMIQLRRAATTREFHRLSTLLKWIMVGGIASMAIIWLNFRF